jgi:hypothetical protein
VVSEPVRPARSTLLAPVVGKPVSDRLQQAADRSAYLSHVARGLSGALQTQRAVDLVLEMLAGPVVDWAQLTMIDPRSYSFRARHADGEVATDQLPAGALSPSSSLARVLATGASDLVLVPDGEDRDSAALVSTVPSEPLREALTAIRPMDMLTIALTARGTTYGALTVAQRGGDGFDQTAVAFLEDFAHQVAVTLDATRAMADSRRVAAVLSRDLDPPTMPTLAGVEMVSYYRVAFEHEAVGGDFYDVHGDDDDWTVVMGDVCGKGVEAAVLTGKVRQTVRTAALVDRDPAAVLALSNQVLVADGVDTFVTTVCGRGRLDGDDLLLDVAAAGHPSPLVVRRDGTVEDVAVSGTVLGLLPGSGYTPVHLRLAPGETCLFYTDGVTEAVGRRSRFGEDRLREVLEGIGSCDAGAQVEALAVALAAHLQDRPHDDIAILAVQARPSGAAS